MRDILIKRIINYNETIFDKQEINIVCDFMKSGRRIAYGEEVLKTEQKLADFLNVKYCLLVNSGSSANFLAFMALTSHQLGTLKIERGEEIIVIACGFPTTVSPIVNFGAIPVFVDIDKTLNIKIDDLGKAISKKTKAVFIAHTLGNPFDVESILDFCHKYGLRLIEDNCDSLGAKHRGKYTGTFGDIGTSSFYPAHQISCGEGGAVYTNDLELYKIMRSLRDWGRDYKCMVCTWDCDKRYINGYDCRYTYSHYGFNFKITELQALLLNKQLDKLLGFIQKRRENWKILRERLNDFDFKFQVQTLLSDPSWFAFYIESENRNKLVPYLEANGIGARPLFAGNLVRQECTRYIEYRVIGDLKNSNRVMDHGFFIGCHPYMTENDINYIVEMIKKHV